MGWTSTDLGRFKLTLEQAKERHVRDCINYTDGIKAELLAHEWHTSTFYAIIRLSYPNEPGRKPVTWLRVDMVELSPSHFAYKDMCEDMGPYVEQAPSAKMKALIYKHIPSVSHLNYAKDFRDRFGIKHDGAENQLNLILA